MSIGSDSKHYNAYYKHITNEEKISGSIGKVYDIINDISDRRGLRFSQEWSQIDDDIQDEIIDNWIKIIENK